MGEGSDGSSSDSADEQQTIGLRRDEALRDEAKRQGQRGFFSRILGAISNSDQSTVDAEGAETNGASAVAGQIMPGTAKLRRVRVDDVMVNKGDIVAVPLDISRADLVDVFRKSGVTRIPVYNGTMDSPVGLIHLKDFALRYGFNGQSGDFELEPLLRPLLFVPPSMLLSALLQKMQSDRKHMALVIDEYGGVDGLVTIEDVVEQVVGEIEDEHDTAEAPSVIAEAPGVWLVKATKPLDEVEAHIGTRLADEAEEEEVDTLGGLVFLLAGHVPARGEVVMHPAGHQFIVVDSDPRRIKRVRVKLSPGLVAADG